MRIIVGMITGLGVTAGIVSEREDVKLINKVQKIEPISESQRTAYDDKFQRLLDRSKRNVGL